MRIRFKKRYIVIAALNAVSLIGTAVLTAVGGSMAGSQSYNYAAERWKGDSDLDYSQISCFFSDDAGFSTDSLNSVKSQFLSELETVSISPEEGIGLITDAYSAPLGKEQVKTDGVGRSDAEVTAVGGDFFFFRDFRLESGAFFRKDDVMQDGAVIDRTLAWNLYGSDDVAGMDIYINDVKLYIAGVIDLPDNDAEEQCIGDTPRAYISYESAALIAPEYDGDYGMGEDYSYTPSFRRINCYEYVMPEKVSDFAENCADKIFGEAYDGKIDVVVNSGRFSPSKRAKAFKKLYKTAVRSDAVRYPYWENASRIVEFRLSYIYGLRKLTYVIPVLTALWLVIKGWMFLRRNKSRIKDFAGRCAEKLRMKIKRRKNKVPGTAESQ